MKFLKKLLSAGLAVSMLVTAVPQAGLSGADVVYAAEADAGATASNGTLVNGSLTANADGWTLGGDADKYGYNFDSSYLSVWNDSVAAFSMSQTITTVEGGDYCASVAIVGKGNQGSSESKDSLTLSLKNDTKNEERSVKLTCDGWDNWENVIKTEPLAITEGDTVTISISGNLEQGEWYGIKNVIFAKETAAVEAPITVQKIEGLSEDFIHGVDVSSYLSVVESGAKYYDENGNEQNLFKILKDGGVNYVRLRVWNCPFPVDQNGEYKYVGADGVTEYQASEVTEAGISVNGMKQYKLISDGTPVYRETYGAGICDVDTAAVIGKLATDYGMKVLIDFHYSDFWADPKKQRVPKAWEGMSQEQKETALYEFTKTSLETLIDAGVDVGMVQVGNEINNGMAGEKDSANVCKLLKKGSAAVRAVASEKSKNILVAVHYTDPQKEGYQYGKATELKNAEVDYDVFATSYYPFWHGSTDQLTAGLQAIAKDFDKKVMVAEISYAWTMEDGDGYGNVVYSGAGDQTYKYSIDAEGQAAAVRDAIAAISAIGDKGIGTFYWEPAWIPVNAYNKTAENAAEVLAANEKQWKLNGSGWGTVYANDYDPEIAADEKGGGTWDNQAFFDFNGKVLPSVNVYKWVYTGAEGPKRVSTVDTASYEMNYKSNPSLPEMAKVQFNDGTSMDVKVTWNAGEVNALKTADFGKHTVHGSLEAFSYETRGETVSVLAGTWTTTCEVTVTGTNYVTNGGFEDGDDSGWMLVNHLGENVGWPKVDKGSSNANSGLYYYQGWENKALDFEIYQTIEKDKLPNGNYTLFAYYQGTGVGKLDDTTSLYATVTYQNGSTKTCQGAVEIHNVWKDFYQAKVKNIIIDPSVKSVQVGTRLAGSSADEELGIWIVVDDIGLMKAGEISTGGGGSGSSSDISTGSSTQQPDKKDDTDKKDDAEQKDDTEKADTIETAKEVTVKGATYEVSASGKKTVEYSGTDNKSKTVTVPATVKIDGKTYKVTAIAANAFKNHTKVTSVTIGSNVTSIGKNAFKGAKKCTTIVIKSDKLTKKALKSCLSGSSVKTVKLTGDAKKMYKKYVKYFTKANCGKKVTVKK